RIFAFQGSDSLEIYIFWHSFQQKHEKSDKIFSSLPVEIVDKLPHPPFFKNLPKETQEQIKQIRRDKSMSWHERHQKIHAIIDALPDDIRPHHPPPGRHRGPPRGGELPPGFEEVLPEDIMQKVNDIRQNSALSDEKKQEKVEDILSSLPVEILEKLPLPPFFEHLPDPVREKLTQIHRDTSLSWRERHRKIFDIVESLPEDQRP
ncbi:hypothetical protein TELCIR_10954, partial [Teladorsagia circumcincta]